MLLRLVQISALAGGTLLATSAVQVDIAEACGVKLVIKANNKPRSRVAAKTKRQVVSTSGTKVARAPERSKERRTPVAVGPAVPDEGTTPKRTRIAAAGGTSAPATRATPTKPAPRPTPARVAAKPEPKKPTVVARAEPPAKKAEEPQPKPTPRVKARTAKKVEVAAAPKKAEPVAVDPFNAEVYFDLGQAGAPGGDSTLDEAVEWLRANPTGRLVVVGHTDPTGSASFNLALSRKRARAVRSYLISNAGVSGRRIRAIGKGESALAYPEDSDKNRRVVIKSR